MLIYHNFTCLISRNNKIIIILYIFQVYSNNYWCIRKDFTTAAREYYIYREKGCIGLLYIYIYCTCVLRRVCKIVCVWRSGGERNSRGLESLSREPYLLAWSRDACLLVYKASLPLAFIYIKSQRDSLSLSLSQLSSTEDLLCVCVRMRSPHRTDAHSLPPL